LTEEEIARRAELREGRSKIENLETPGKLISYWNSAQSSFSFIDKTILFFGVNFFVIPLEFRKLKLICRLSSKTANLGGDNPISLRAAVRGSTSAIPKEPRFGLGAARLSL